jgi:hypothetical protein
MAFLKYFLAETESLWSQEPVTRDFLKLNSIRPRYSTFKHFFVCSASDEICSELPSMLNYSKMQILALINKKKPYRNPSNKTKMNILKEKFFLDSLPKLFGSAYAQSQRKCSNIEILAKIKGKESKFFQKITNAI